MRSLYPAIVVLLTGVVLASSASAATALFDIRPADNLAADEIVVAPGSAVAYRIAVQIISDDPFSPDSQGLAFFRVSIATDLGVAQPPVDGFDPAIAEAFSLLPKLGEPRDDDVIEIGAAQDTLLGLTELLPGVGLDQSQVIVYGSLMVPQAEGLFTVRIDPDARANVFAADGSFAVERADVDVGPGFSILVIDHTPPDSQPDEPDGPDGDQPTDDTQDDNTQDDNGGAPTEPPADDTPGGQTDAGDDGSGTDADGGEDSPPADDETNNTATTPAASPIQSFLQNLLTTGALTAAVGGLVSLLALLGAISVGVTIAVAIAALLLIVLLLLI